MKNKPLLDVQKMLSQWMPEEWTNDKDEIYPIELSGRDLTRLFRALHKALKVSAMLAVVALTIIEFPKQPAPLCAGAQCVEER